MRNMMIAMGLSLVGSACVQGDQEQPEDELGSTEQAVNGWLEGGYTTTTAGAWNTHKDADHSTCVLSQIAGNLGPGDYWDFDTDLRSAGGVSINAANGDWEVFANGGAYTNNTNDRVWAYNVVTASAVCVNYPMVPSSMKWWGSGDNPQKLASLATVNRQCFLQAIVGGAQIFRHSDDYVRVKRYTTTDASHPTTGWYVEGNLVSSDVTGAPAAAKAICIDFPSITDSWPSALEVPGTHTLTSGSGIKMCGLQTVMGGYTVDTWNNGVTIDPPLGLPNGQWTLTVSSGKRARVMCVE